METILPEDRPTQVLVEHALYRFFAEDGTLLYVGISIHPFARMGQHRGDKSWWGEVSSTTIVRYPNLPEVLAAEREAIKAERPKYNIVHARPTAKKDKAEKLWVTYTYIEPATGSEVSVPNIFPMHPGAFLLRCHGCDINFSASEILDFDGGPFRAVGECRPCRVTVEKWVDRVHPRGVPHLTEASPYLLMRQSRGKR